MVSLVNTLLQMYCWVASVNLCNTL